MWGSWLMSGSHARLMCRILVYGSRLYTDFRLISLKFLNYSNFPYNLFSHKIPHFMQFSLAEHEPCMFHCVLFHCKHKTYSKCPKHPSSCLITTAAERNKVSTGCYFFACLVFSPHDMNAFVRDLIVDNVTHMHRFGILIIFFEKLCVKCEGI